MGQQKAFWWKVGYIVAIFALVVPLHLLSQPATRHSDGGKLARLRKEYDLSEANLGEVDVSAETVKLATLGLRGIAVDILWNKAADYKMKEDWAGFGAVLTQIAYLQPHFYSVWDFQAHNLTYNTSVEFDDYHARYYWVMEGIKFLKLGQKENIHEPRITGRIGWFIGQKIGKADEHRQYRRLFKQDDKFHAEDDPSRPLSQRDNWLVSYSKYKQGQEQVRRGDPLRTTPLIFHSQPMMSLISYAEDLESDSTAGETPKFGEVAKNAWDHADREKDEFGARDLAAPDNTIVHLNAEEDLIAREKRLEEQLEKLLPGEFERVKLATRDKQTPQQRISLDLPFDKRTAPQENDWILWWNEVAERTSPDRRAKARKLAADLTNTESAAREIRMSRDIVNYNYWKTRCEAEPTDDALAARQLMYQAGQEQMEARPTTAKKLYEQSFAAWRKVLDRWKVLREDTLMAEDLADVVEKYRDVLRQLAGADSKFPAHFILQDVLDLNDRTNPRPKMAVKGEPQTAAKTKPTGTKTPAEKTPAAQRPDSKSPAPAAPKSKAPPAAKPPATKSDGKP
ncbi:MAG TPA: hypothetical protein VHX65_11465 [Pirellulales bacterium]|jgi:hypothetical protein|nr:hypothetical protein [Pirellulales bacterium]